MSVFENLKEFLRQKDKKSESNSPKGFCPNCWGRQEYAGDFYEAVKMEGIDTLNIEKKKGWIQAYAEKNLSGIQLQKNDAGLICNNCKVNYTHQD